MKIEKIKNNLENKKGKRLKFKFNGTRNQIEEFNGIIENTYNYVFIVKVQNEHEQIRSFSYTDILTDSLEILQDVENSD